MVAQYLLLFVAGLVAGVVNTLSGGGSLLTLPALIALGLTPAQANASNRISVLLQSATAAHQLRRTLPYPVGLTLKLAVPAVLGSVAGASVSMALSAGALKAALGVALLVGLVFTVASPKGILKGKGKGAEEGVEEAPRVGVGLIVAMAGVGFYTGMLQAGVGVLYTLTLCGLWELTRASSAKNLIIFVCTVPALGLFWGYGLVKPLPALVLSAGSVGGVWLTARYVGKLPNVRGVLLVFLSVSVVVTATYLIFF
jgi:uncharacterized protein